MNYELEKHYENKTEEQMTIKFIDLYNEVAEQAWSMYDSGVTEKDEFESALKSSIQKALSEIWCSYNFPFRLKTQKIKTKPNKADYELPSGKIFIKTINGREKYSIKCGPVFLDYLDNYETLDPDNTETGECEYFYIKGDKLYLYPIPDDIYTVQILIIIYCRKKVNNNPNKQPNILLYHLSLKQLCNSESEPLSLTPSLRKA